MSKSLTFHPLLSYVGKKHYPIVASSYKADAMRAHPLISTSLIIRERYTEHCLDFRGQTLLIISLEEKTS